MKYCMKCRQPMNDTDNFCPACGYGKQIHIPNYHAPHFPNHGTTEPKEKLVQELAYSGVLFWLPLLSAKDGKNKIHANRGLWILLLTATDCLISQLLRWGTEFLGNFGKIIYGIAVLPCLLFMLFLAGNSVMAVLSIHQGNEQEKMLWFDDYKIIGR